MIGRWVPIPGWLIITAVAATIAARAEEPREASPDLAQLTITATDFTAEPGSAVVTLYRRGENWLDGDKAFRRLVVPIEGDTVTVAVEVPPDRYAVTVVHDENGNGKLDMRWFPWPRAKEGTGFSNEYRPSMKPSYEKAEFEHTSSPSTLRIRMHY